MKSNCDAKPAPASRIGLRQIVEVTILLGAVFAADIALARIVDLALDAIH